MVRALSAAVGTGVGKAAALSTLPKGGSRRPSMERPARRCQRSSPQRADEGRTQSRKRRADERTRTAAPISLRVKCSYWIILCFILLDNCRYQRERWCVNRCNERPLIGDPLVG